MNKLINLKLVIWLTLSSTLIRCSEKNLKKCLRATFHENTMENIRHVMKKKDTCVISLIMFYDSKGKNPIKVYRALSCVLYYLIENYVFIDYLSCQSKTLIIIYSNIIL